MSLNQRNEINGNMNFNNIMINNSNNTINFFQNVRIDKKYMMIFDTDAGDESIFFNESL